MVSDESGRESSDINENEDNHQEEQEKDEDTSTGQSTPRVLASKPTKYRRRNADRIDPVGKVMIDYIDMKNTIPLNANRMKMTNS